MSAKAFLDTNVLLRSRFNHLPLHKEAASLILQQRQQGLELWISRQVIREYFVQLTYPGFAAEPISVEILERQLNDLITFFRIADDTEAVTFHLMALIKEFPTGGKQIHDANIVATMLANGIDTLLTQNLAHMQRFQSKIVIVPLVSEFS